MGKCLLDKRSVLAWEHGGGGEDLSGLDILFMNNAPVMWKSNVTSSTVEAESINTDFSLGVFNDYKAIIIISKYINVTSSGTSLNVINSTFSTFTYTNTLFLTKGSSGIASLVGGAHNWSKGYVDDSTYDSNPPTARDYEFTADGEIKWTYMNNSKNYSYYKSTFKSGSTNPTNQYLVRPYPYIIYGIK